MATLALFEDLAKVTWARVTDAYELGVSFGEETISDINLLEIRRASLIDVEVRKFEKHQEAVSGVDWELWIGSDACGWLRYAVQAKKLSLGTGKYNSFRHEIRDGLNPRWQIERLQRYAATVPMCIPAYCFYNGGVHSELPPWLAGQADYMQFGCSIVGLPNAITWHNRRATRTFDELNGNGAGIPWRDLIREHCNWTRRQALHPALAQDQQPLIQRFVFASLPRGLREFVRGEIEELPVGLYPEHDRELGPPPLPRRMAIVPVSTERDGNIR